MNAVQRLSRIILICRDAKRLAAFYAGAFGFICVEPLRADPTLAALIGRAEAEAMRLRLGDQMIDLAAVKPEGRAYPSGIAGWHPLFQHFAIVVSDMTAAYAGLQRTAGWTPISTAGPQPLPAASGGVTAFKFRDPEGHPLELLAYAPGATPAAWTIRGGPCLGIDHSAISIADTARSVSFYDRLGLARTAGSHNVGVEQDRLDGIAGATVDVTALAPAQPTPHVELLCYRGDFDRSGTSADPGDVAATQLVFAVSSRAALDELIAASGAAVVAGPIVTPNGAAALLRDPDGHLVQFVSAHHV